MRRRRNDERGIGLPLYALAAVALLTVVALVLDGGQLRSDFRTNKSIADASTRAGVGRLQFGAWSGVCKARDYLLSNARGFSQFDAGSETWSNAASPAVFLGTSPCPATVTNPSSACVPNTPSTWARLQATAGGGRFTIEIQAGYVLPDPRFPEDGVSAGDVGAADQGSCDNLAVIITQRRSHFFARLAGVSQTTTRVRSVSRLNAIETVDYVAALQLLEQHACGVLQTGGTNTRVVVQPKGSHPGIIQVDSIDDAGSCPQPIINGQATSSGPSIVACSVNSALSICQPGTGSRASRVGVYALNFSRPAGDIASAYPGTYGDTKVVATPRAGRRYADRRYRANVAALEADAKAVLSGNAGLPPGCTSVLNNSCVGKGITWLVLQPTECGSLSTFFSVAGRTSSPSIWFNCDLDVASPLTLSAPNSTIVVTGSVRVRSSFVITDPRTIYIGGRSVGNQVGLADGSSGSVLNINMGSASSCSGRTGAGHATKLVIASGSLNVGSGSNVHLCQTFVYLASGYGTLPATDGTPPCYSPCSSYNGTLTVSSGAVIDWSAPNEITNRLPEPTELATTNRFEDLALWTEAGGNTNGITGGGSTSLAGVFFLPNANSFNLAGGGALPIYLSAQFIATTLKVTGGATVNLVPTPEDSIAVTVYSTVLVR